MKTIFPLVRQTLPRSPLGIRRLSDYAALVAVGVAGLVYTAPPAHGAAIVDSDAYGYNALVSEPMAAPVSDFDSGSLPASNTLTGVGANLSVGTPPPPPGSEFAQSDTDLSVTLTPGTGVPTTNGFSLDTDGSVNTQANGTNNGPGDQYFADGQTDFSLDFTITGLPAAFTLTGTLNSNGSSGGDSSSTALATVILTNLGSGDQIVNESSSGALFGDAVNEAGPLMAGSYRIAYDAAASVAEAPGTPPSPTQFSAAFDDFDFAVTQPIPEPTTLALLGLSGVCLLLGRQPFRQRERD